MRFSRMSNRQPSCTNQVMTRRRKLEFAETQKHTFDRVQTQVGARGHPHAHVLVYSYVCSFMRMHGCGWMDERMEMLKIHVSNPNQRANDYA